MSKTISHAKQELRILAETTPYSLILPFTKEIHALCKAFGKSGQSGGSAPYVAKALSQSIEKLLLFEILSPLTGNDDEWCSVGEKTDNTIIYQNSRDVRVFKEGSDNDGAYFLDAIVFDGDVGGRFTGFNIGDEDESVNSFQYIKSFPFTPKTFYIDVIDYRWKDTEGTISDEDGNWWTHKIKDINQLKEVFEYYNSSKVKK